MKRRLFIHPGLHKTGTTFLQQCVFQNIEGIRYYLKSVDPLSIKPDGITLISDEELSRSMPHKQNRMEMMGKLHQSFPDAHIILGIREEKSWLKSCYAQYVKTGGSLRFDDYCQQYPYVPPHEYAEIVSSMWDDVLIYDHADLKKDHRAVVQRICDFMGVPVPSYENRQVNVSLRGRWLEFYRVINKAFMGEVLRRHIESPYWILTAPMRRIKGGLPSHKGERIEKKMHLRGQP